MMEGMTRIDPAGERNRPFSNANTASYQCRLAGFGTSAEKFYDQSASRQPHLASGGTQMPNSGNPRL